MLKKITLAITLFFCLGLISCGETNQPIDEPFIINIGDNEPIVDNPVVTIDDDGRIVIDDHFIYDLYDASNGAYAGALVHHATIASDLIVITEVYEIDNSKNPHTAYLSITETLHGSTDYTEIQVNTNRFSKDEKYIIFLRRDGDSYVLTCNGNDGWDYYTSSIISLNMPWVEAEIWKDDIKSILSAYNKSKELFSEAGKQDVYQLYPQLKSWFIKTEVLFTIWRIGIDEQDLPVLLEWQQIETDRTVLSILGHFIGIIERKEG